MALIKCPECGDMVSSAAKSCIHCGFPMGNIIADDCCIINGKVHNLSEIKNKIIEADFSDRAVTNSIADELFRKVRTISIYAAFDLAKIIHDTGEVPKSYDGSKFGSGFRKDDGVLRCPKCKSTSVTTGSRGYSVVWGFVGSNETMNRCGKCGYKWAPKRR